MHVTILLWRSATCDICDSIAMMFRYLWSCDSIAMMFTLFSYLLYMRQYCYDVQLHVMYVVVLLWCSATCEACDRCSATCDACDGVSGDIHHIQLPVMLAALFLWCSSTCDACDSIAMMFSYLWCLRHYCNDVQLLVMHVMVYCYDVCIPVMHVTDDRLPVMHVMVYPEIFCCWTGALPPARRFQHWIVPSSQDEKTRDGRDSDQQPPVRLVWGKDELR